jgi:hypothetical protein
VVYRLGFMPSRIFFLFVSNEHSSSVPVLDGDTFQQLAMIATFDRRSDIFTSEDGKLAFVAWPREPNGCRRRGNFGGAALCGATRRCSARSRPLVAVPRQ